MSQTPRSPVPQEVSTELQRVVERWHQLPLDHALSYAARVRMLVQSLADGLAEANGVPTSVVPDLGPATLMDQLTVLVYDASAAAGLAPARPSRASASAASATAASASAASATAASASAASAMAASASATLAEDLASLRRELA